MSQQLPSSASETTLVASDSASISSRTPLVQSDGRQQPQQPQPQRKRPEMAYKWGITPKPGDDTHTKTIAELPSDHPVHRLTPEEQDALRKKGINPVLKAEMDWAVTGNDGEKSKWKSFKRSLAQQSMNIR